MEPVTVRWKGEDWEPTPELEALLYEVMYEPFGVPAHAPWSAEEPGSATAVALGADGCVLGTARLLAAGQDGGCRIRQVAVLPAARTQGVGRALMGAVEQRARERAGSFVWLDARDTAFVFYERLGYEYCGEPFVSEMTGIVHRCMRKGL